jgi:TonB family protein
MMMRVCTFFLFFAFAPLVYAEDIRGTLYSPNGAVIPGARVMLMNEDYVKLAETKSGEHGEFVFQDLKPALFFVQAKKPMFQLTQHHVFLTAGQSERIYLVASVASGEDRFSAAVERLMEANSPAAAHAVSGQPEPFKRLGGRPPGMPDSVKRRGVHGSVALFATIQTDGSITDIVTLESPDAELEQVCRESFQQWRYVPMMLDGKPIKSTELVVFEFNPPPPKP